jgi:hypothetical protein
LAQTPKQAKQENKETIKATIKISEDGSANVQYTSMLAGSQHERYRYMHHNYSEDEQRKWVLKQLEIPNFQLDSYEIKSEASIPCAQYDFKGTSSKYVSTSGSRMFIPINKISTYLGIPDKDDARQLPVIKEEDYQEDLEIEIQLPEGWEPESLPAVEKSFSSPFGTYEMTCQRNGNRILLKRKIQFNRHTGDPESYEDFRKFYRNINRAEQSQIVVKL